MTQLALLLAAGALPAPASALDLGGYLGANYLRWDAETPASSFTQDDVTVDIGASTAGEVGPPGALMWDARCDYRWRRLTTDQVEAAGFGFRDTSLTYRLSLSALRMRRSPVQLGADASRVQSDFTPDATTSPLGTVTTTYGGNLGTSLGSGPALVASYQRVEMDWSRPSLADGETNQHQYRVALKQAAAAYHLNASFSGIESDGTFDNDNFRSLDARISALTVLSPRTRLSLTESYSERAPTTPGATNAELRTNYFTALFDHGLSGSVADSTSTQYSYAESEAFSSALGPMQRAVHRLSQTAYVTRDPSFRYSGQIELSFDQDRRGTREERAAAQTIGASGDKRWTLASALVFLRGGPTVGLVEPLSGGTRFGYGANVSTGFNNFHYLGALFSLTYDARYQSSLFAAKGWAFTHSLRGSLEKRLASTLSLGASLGASVNRAATEGVDSASRTFEATAYVRHRLARLDLRTGVSSGFAGAAASDVPTGDGLFLPYNTHSSYVNATLTAPLGAGLQFQSVGRYAYVSAPDRPSTEDEAAMARLLWTRAGLTLSIEDEYRRTDSSDGTRVRDNRFMVRATRAFGSRN